MRLLLDTNVVLWWFEDNPRLGVEAKRLIADETNEVMVSEVSLWEIVIKSRIGKLQLDFTELVTTIEQEFM